MNVKYGVLGIVIVVATFLIPDLVFAWSEDFDDYSLGDLSGQGSWVSENERASSTISSFDFVSVPNSLNLKTYSGVTSGMSSSTLYFSSEDFTDSSLYFGGSFNWVDGHAYNENGLHFRFNGRDIFSITQYLNGTPYLRIRLDDTQIFNSVEKDVWNDFVLRIDFEDSSPVNACFSLNGSDYVCDSSILNFSTLDSVISTFSLNLYSNMDDFISIYLDDLVLSGYINNVGDYSTRIIELVPANDEVIPIVFGEGATTTISVSYYVSEDDLSWFEGITLWFENVDQNTLYGFSSVSPYSYSTTEHPKTAGYHYLSYEIWLPRGGYAVHARIQGNILGIVNPFTSISYLVTESQDNSHPLSQYHYYIVGSSTYLSSLRQTSGDLLEEVLSATSTASSTPSLSDCNILYGFDFGKCMAFSFIPSGKNLSNFVSKVSTGVFSKFPLGYVWNFYQIMISTTTISLPVVDVVIPASLPGAGAELEFTLEPDMLDFVWNATTSVFSGYNSNTDSDSTLLETILGYWNIFVYFSVSFYILSRILGSHVIGSFISSEYNEAGVNVRRGRSLWNRYKNRGGGKDVRNLKIVDYYDESSRNFRNMRNNRLIK